MKSKLAPNIFNTSKKFFRKVKFSWIATFMLVCTFLIMNAGPALSQSNGNALRVYYNVDNTNGAVPAMLAGVNGMMFGKSDGESGTASYSNGVLYQVAQITDTFYEVKPASAIVWAYNEYNQVAGYESITVEAQQDSSVYNPGTGFELLRPILGFWQWTRNIAYSFFIIILVVIAFLILFRQSLGGQTIVNVANALPSILVALLLVTLSYPISAAFIDLVTIGSGFMQSVMITASGAPGNNLNTTTTPNLNHLQPNDPQMGVFSIWGTANANTCDRNAEEDCGIQEILPLFLDGEGPESAFIGEIAKILDNGALGFGTNELLKLLLGLVALGAAFRLLLALLNNYLILTTMPIFSPFIFLVAAIPGRGSVITNYLKTMLAASLVFIVIYGIFLFLTLVGNSTELGDAFSQASQIQWTPPLVGYGGDGQDVPSELFKLIVIYGVFLFLPSIPDLIKNNLGVPTGNYFFSVVQQRSTQNASVLNEARKRIVSLLPGTGPQQ